MRILIILPWQTTTPKRDYEWKKVKFWERKEIWNASLDGVMILILAFAILFLWRNMLFGIFVEIFLNILPNLAISFKRDISDSSLKRIIKNIKIIKGEIALVVVTKKKLNIIWLTMDKGVDELIADFQEDRVKVRSQFLEDYYEQLKLGKRSEYDPRDPLGPRLSSHWQYDKFINASILK